MRTGYEIREGSIILARRFGTLDARQSDPLGLPCVEQAVPPCDALPSSSGQGVALSPRPAPPGKKAA